MRPVLNPSDSDPKIIRFPGSPGSCTAGRPRPAPGVRVFRAEQLPGFRVVSAEERAFNQRPPDEQRIDRALGLDFSRAPLVIEMDDPHFHGRRDHNVRFFQHEGGRWVTTWMDRSQVPGKIRYGLRRG